MPTIVFVNEGKAANVQTGTTVLQARIRGNVAFHPLMIPKVDLY